MEKHSYVGKTKEDAIKEAIIDLQEVEENLIIKLSLTSCKSISADFIASSFVFPT